VPHIQWVSASETIVIDDRMGRYAIRMSPYPGRQLVCLFSLISSILACAIYAMFDANRLSDAILLDES
jgi:hypothetical protein